MGKLCSRSCFSAFILISLLSHIIELGFNIYFACTLWSSGGARIWFSLTTGLIIIPLVSVQLASAIFYLQRQGDSTALWRHALMAFIHVVQLGFCWRHIAILKEHFVVMKKKSLSELFLLRFMFTVTSGLPLLLIQTYLFLNESPIPRSWILCVSIGITLFSSAWAVASYRRQYASCESDKLVITWPGSVFRLVWRVSELGSRIISLALFASLYKYWIFLVISFHWITMCLCVCTSVISSVSGTGCYRILKGVVAAYTYIFCFVNINRDNSAFRYTLFYIIMFLENATLCAVWMFMVPDVQTGYKYLLIFITASSFFVSVVAMSIYYKFFHVHSSNVSNDVKYGASDSEECINCKLSVCVKHNKQHQRPFNTAWLSQYDPRLIQDQYFKNLLQDSFAESSVPGDRNSTISTALSNPNLDVRNLETMSEEERHSVISFISSGTYVHRRYMDQQYQFQCDSWSEYSSDSHSVGRDRFSSTGSDTDSLSQNWENQVPKTLLTDNWEGIEGKVQNARRTQLSSEQFNSLLRKDSHNWYSDDGSAIQGRNLEWSRLPVTKIARRNYKPQTESDTDSCSYRRPIRKKSKTPTIKPRKIQINMNSVDAVSEKDRAANANDKSANINRLTGGKRHKITRHVQYVNDDNVYMEMKSPVKLSAVYENVAFTDDILAQPEKVFNVRRDKGDNSSAPWYACSESGDSALPTETFSSSNCAVTDIDNESQSSIEFMI